jgi:hypothetical protein
VKLPSQKAALAKLAFVGLQQRLLSSIPAFARTLKAHRKTLQRLLDGEVYRVVEEVAQTFVDGSTTGKVEGLEVDDEETETGLDADEDVATEAASVAGAAGAAVPDLKKELAAVDEMLAIAEPAPVRNILEQNMMEASAAKQQQSIADKDRLVAGEALSPAYLAKIGTRKSGCKQVGPWRDILS